MTVAIIDYGMGNLGSVRRAVAELGSDAVLVKDPQHLSEYEQVILPGVGNFAEAMTLLRRAGWDEALRSAVIQGKAVLGICLGMQLLAERGTEGGSEPISSPGLGLLPGSVKRLSDLGCSLRVPHMGWNSVSICGDSPLMQGIPDGTDFYFVHSFAFSEVHAPEVVAACEYGIQMVAAVQDGNVFGTQFHPEKSSRAGFRILANFLAHQPC
jgi:glutamine amidotransferase